MKQLFFKTPDDPAVAKPPPQPEGEEQSTPIEPEPTIRWRALINLIIFVIILSFALSGPAMRYLGAYLVLRDEPGKADVIVILGGSPAVRGLAGADYYNQGLAPRVFLCRGGLERAELLKGLDLSDTGNWGLTRRILTEKGVPAEAVTLDPIFVDSTFAEAKRVQAFLLGHQLTSMILVTSDFHSRRAYLTLSKVLGPGIRIISLPSQYDVYQADAWWRDRYSAKRVVMEYQKLLFFKWESFWEDE